MISIAHAMLLENIGHMQYIYCDVWLSRGGRAPPDESGSCQGFFPTIFTSYGFFPLPQSPLTCWLEALNDGFLKGCDSVNQKKMKEIKSTWHFQKHHRGERLFEYNIYFLIAIWIRHHKKRLCGYCISLKALFSVYFSLYLLLNLKRE